MYLTGRAKDLIIRGGHNIDPRVIEEALLAHPAVPAAAAVGRPDRHSGEVPVAYVVPAGPGTFDEAELLAWAAHAIGEPAARPKHIYPVHGIPLTAVGKQFKPALAADAAARAVTEALAAAGLPDARATATHEDGRLVVTVTGADPGQVRDAVAGFALTIRCGRRPPLRPPRSDPQRDTTMNDQHPRPGARHRRRRRPGRLHRGPAARRLRHPRHPARTPHRAAPAATGGPPGRRGGPDPGPDRCQRGVPGPVPAGSGLRLLDAGHRVMAEFGRDHQPGVHGFPQANMFHQPDLEELLLARVAEHPLIDFRRGAADVCGLEGQAASRSPRPRCGCAPSSPRSRRPSPARSCWAATAPTARSGSWPEFPWRTWDSPSAGW